MNNNTTMASPQRETILTSHLYDLYKVFYGYTLLFPKKDRHTLGNKCEMYIITIIELSIAASSVPSREDRKTILTQMNIKLDALKLFVRLTRDVDILDIKKYVILQQRIQEIGRMIGGWSKSLN